jgi:hypothetical protein
MAASVSKGLYTVSTLSTLSTLSLHRLPLYRLGPLGPGHFEISGSNVGVERPTLGNRENLMESRG